MTLDEEEDVQNELAALQRETEVVSLIDINRFIETYCTDVYVRKPRCRTLLCIYLPSQSQCPKFQRRLCLPKVCRMHLLNIDGKCLLT